MFPTFKKFSLYPELKHTTTSSNTNYMPDISMCEGLDCPKKEKCYRFMAIPTPRNQSYFSVPPFTNEDKFECLYYWNISINHATTTIKIDNN